MDEHIYHHVMAYLLTTQQVLSRNLTATN